LVQPAPTKDQLQTGKFRNPADKDRHEIITESLEIAPEAEGRRLFRIGFRNGDLVVRRTSPMYSAGVDHDWKFVSPRSRQLASKQLLANGCDRNVDAECFRHGAGICACCDDVSRAGLHFLNVTRNILSAQLLRLRAKRSKHCTWIDISI